MKRLAVFIATFFPYEFAFPIEILAPRPRHIALLN